MSLVEIDDGFDFRVLAVDGTWIFRFARRAGVVTALETEVALLPAIAPLLPVAVPRFEYVSREPAFVVYELIGGEPLVAEDPDGVRAFLDALHSFDVTALPSHRSIGSTRTTHNARRSISSSSRSSTKPYARSRGRSSPRSSR